MATLTTTTKTRRVCFSFAAYAKNVIDHLKSCRIPVLKGLTEHEFSSIEASFNIVFPPDLRSILAEGLPVGPGFPNWRSSSIQQLKILVNLPILGITKEISKGRFWCESWGHEPDDPDKALALAKQLLNKAPTLVPIYGHCYIPSTPNLAGNPVFFVHGGDIRYSSFDVAGFFQQVEFREKNVVFRPVHLSRMKAPVWAAKAARRIEVWSDLVENGSCGGRDGKCGTLKSVLGDCFDEMCWILRDGGWPDDEVKEMMTMTTTKATKATDHGDEDSRGLGVGGAVSRVKESVMSHVRFLSVVMLRAGWSLEDVAYSLGISQEILPKFVNGSDTCSDSQAPTTRALVLAGTPRVATQYAP